MYVPDIHQSTGERQRGQAERRGDVMEMRGALGASQRSRQFIQRAAVGALLAFEVMLVLLSVTTIVFYGVYDPHSLVRRQPLLIWIPFAVAALCTVSLALAAGVGAARRAVQSRQERWSTGLRVLLALAIVTLVLLAISRNSAGTTLLVPIATLIYLTLPALALLSVGRRAGLRLLAAGAWVAGAMTLALLVLTFLFPGFGMDPSQTYDIYFPPQIAAAFFTFGAGAISSVAAGIVCAVDGRLTGHLNWSNSFLTAVVAGLLGPFALAMQVHYPPLLSLSPTLEVALVILSLASYLALPVMALVYLRKRPDSLASAGLPDVGISL